MGQKYREMLKIFPEKIRDEFNKRGEDFQQILEIRIRLGHKVCLIKNTGEERLENIITESDILQISEMVSGYSMYACEEEIKNGFITLKGGHRVGITGETVMEKGRIKTIKNITSFNIRFSREVIGCADEFMEHAKGNVLIISPPRLGKTTLLRDMLRQISNTELENVGIVDERSEIAACYRGCPINDVGERTDVLDGCPKAEGMLMLLRSMSPTVIGVDELGKEDDIEAVLRVVNCGVRVIATIHGEELSEIRKKKVFQRIFENTVFQNYIILKKDYSEIYNEQFLLKKKVTRK